MNKIVAITIDGESRNVIIIPEHWNHGQSGFENADVYLVVDAEDEKPLASVGFTEDKSNWEINSNLGGEADDEIINFIKSQSPLTDL